jgi:hypothetical protein
MASEVGGTYEAPVLTDLGSLADLTKGSGGILHADVSLGIGDINLSVVVKIP